VLRFELIRDSGGAGKFRGGLGIRREYLNLQDARFSIRSTKHVIAPEGATGGGKGRTGDIIVNPGSDKPQRLPTRYADYPLKAGDIFQLDTPGGGGLGHAFERDPSLVLADVREGYVSRERARTDYGVVITGGDSAWALDEAATARVREEAAAGAGRS
jgi:N-methylhydantoinase B